MPAIVVLKNGIELAAVNTDHFGIMTVNLHGDVTGDEFSTLDFFGGVYGSGDKDCHLLWVHDVEVLSSDTIEIQFSDPVPSETRGRTIEEIYPKENSDEPVSETMEETFEHLKGLPRIRQKFRFRIETSDGAVSNTESDESDWSYHCMTMWQNFKPDRMRVSLTSDELTHIKDQEPGRKLFGHTLHQGDWIRISFVTP